MLMRFDPFRELDRLTQAPWGGSRPVMPMDAYRRNGDFVVHFDLPGIDPGTIDLTVEKNVLTVAAERRFAKQEGDEITVSERPQGRFSRQLFLGESLDPDRIKANYDQGVLTLHIPIAERAKPRKVEISSGSPEAVEVTTSAA
ncbi:MAG TPA: Hsp20/alpha crystallin family protein [Acidimicrobiia bacterium]|nr:Hsp20/alpha crystallin family protein [Acidimicrobiia bacterium]